MILPYHWRVADLHSDAFRSQNGPTLKTFYPKSSVRSLGVPTLVVLAE
jgi:hypothetical protein